MPLLSLNQSVDGAGRASPAEIPVLDLRARISRLTWRIHRIRFQLQLRHQLGGGGELPGGGGKKFAIGGHRGLRELFGHEKGAFTGAHVRKAGLVAAARGGTLFLDEIGDIPLSLQVKLLRLLETGTYRRVGSAEPEQADFRLICATHQPLKTMMEEGAFRKDLYYRVNTFPIRVPALRERKEDLPLLVEALLRRLGLHSKLSLSEDALECLRSYDFPGNIRELRNILERASLMADGSTILGSHLPEECRCGGQAVPEPDPRADDVVPLDEIERRYLRRVVARFPGDKRQLANMLGVSERTLYRKIRAFSSGGSPEDIER